VIGNGKAMTNREMSQSSKRIQHILALNTRTANLDPKRTSDCKEAVWASYEAASLVTQTTRIVNESNIAAIGFQSIGLRHLIKLTEFNAPDYYWGPYFSDVGRSVASGERRYLQEQIQGEIKPESQSISRSNPNFSILVKCIESLIENDFTPDTLLAPIEVFVDFVNTSMLQIDWNSGRPEQLVLKDIRLKVFWSHKYAPLDSFIILSSEAGLWHVIPDQDTGRLITIALGESEERAGYVEYWAEVLAKYQIIKHQAFAIIKLSGEPKERNR
jgi:hypothetical protein